MSNSIILEDFLTFIDSEFINSEYYSYDFEQTIAVESTHYPYDISDNNTFDNFYVTIKDIKEHVTNDNHEKITFTSLRKHRKAEYVSYFLQYYLNHQESLIDMIESAVRANSENILEYIANTKKSRYFFKQAFPRNIGDVYGKERSGKTKVLGVILGIDRKDKYVYLVSAYPVFEDYEPNEYD